MDALRSKTNVLAAAAVLALGLGGVAFASHGSSHAAKVVNVSVLPTGKLQFSVKTLPAGAVTFVVAHKDLKSKHAFAVMGLGLHKQTKAITAGTTAKLTVTLKPGSYHFWDPIRSKMSRAVFLNVKSSATGSKSSGSGTGSGSGSYTPPPMAGGETSGVDHAGMEGCDH